MKKAEVVSAEEVEVKALDLTMFLAKQSRQHTAAKSVNKKEIREIAERLGLSYDDAQLSFTKKIMNAYRIKETK